MTGGVSLSTPGVGQTMETVSFITLSFQVKLPVISAGHILFEVNVAGDVKSGIGVDEVVVVVDLSIGE